MNPHTAGRLYDESTIVAVATPPGYGGIGVVRLSGSSSLDLASRLFPERNTPLLHLRPSLAILKDPADGHAIDEALVTYFKGPNSYTGEDIVEISCHGSPVILGEVIRVLRSLGAELARPGEFTMRAFLNRRIDLTQAEAVNDLIHSQTRFQAQVAARQLGGELSKTLSPLKAQLIEIIVHFESAVEFVEDDLDELDKSRFIEVLASLRTRIEALISTHRVGRLLRHGIRLALVGRPNVGKSSLFNRLLGRDRAIVTDIPGTTRDTLTEVHSINGIPVELIDTAGIRQTTDLVEKLGVERTRTAIAEADFVIGLLEADQQLEEEDLRELEGIRLDLLVVNKIDLPHKLTVDELAGLALSDACGSPVYVSALTGEGIETLTQRISDAVTGGIQLQQESALITNERHVSALEAALSALNSAARDLNSSHTEEVALVNLHEALRQLGIVTGETLIGDIINQIFSTFCIGK